MSGNIYEFFGYSPEDKSALAVKARKKFYCPFIDDRCTKIVNQTLPGGACTIKQVESGPVICCPNRLYGEDNRILNDIAVSAFGARHELVPGEDIKKAKRGKPIVAVFGKRWGGELRLPKKGGKGNYFMDWILVLVDKDGELEEFVAIEVQSIDTTGNYRAEREALLKGKAPKRSTVGLNWENVNKRILPQLIYKGNVLRQEDLCRKGLYFVCPTPVYKRIIERLGGTLGKYKPHPGTITFATYDLGGGDMAPSQIRCLEAGEMFTTTVEQVSNAFDRADGLPQPGVYEQAIRRVLDGG